MYRISTNFRHRLYAYVSKILKVMKLTAALLIATMLQVSASTLAQKVTFDKKNIPLNQIFKEIKNQTGYTVLYRSINLDAKEKISVKFDMATLKQVMDRCLEGKDLSYLIEEKTIIIASNKKKNDEIINTTVNFYSKINVTGRILDEEGVPLVGATVKVKNTNKTVLTNKDGYFNLKNVDNEAVLIISYVGYKTKEVVVYSGTMSISLEVASSDLEAITVVSTGYQTLPKERVTGSFERIDNKLFNRTTGTNVLPRLLGTAAGIYFNNRSATFPRGGVGDAISIRGISSFANSVAPPLVVLDNIPYDGDLSNLNPNDVQDITILKDAAAASIWGTRAGNGVIVITTKKGVYDKSMQISLNTNVTVTQKPDLFYLPQMSSSDVISVEKMLFANKYYDNKISTTSPFPPFLTPVVELLVKQQTLPVTDVQGRAQIDNQINSLGQHDVRNDYLKYVYRKAVNQQYALNVSGGSKQISYMLSAGYDRNLNNMVTSNYNRTSLRSNINFKPIQQLDIQTSFLYTKSKTTDVVGVSAISYDPSIYYPYARLADDSGNPLAPGMLYRASYLDNLSTNAQLLDWRNKPLEDMNKTSYIGNSEDVLFNLGTTYTLNPVFSAEVKYQYENTNSSSNSLYNQDSYYTRNLINYYTDPTTYNRAIPLGAINSPTASKFNSQTIRGQINANKNWNNKHELTAIAGAEARKTYSLSSILSTLYGFDPNTNVFQNVDTKNQFPLYYGGTAQIPNQPSIDDNNKRFTSLFANAAYTYNNRYSISASVRKDASNVFGDNANKQGTPLWSVGASWNIASEDFYKFNLLPKLKLRVTYGYSGNVVTGVPAYAVVTYLGSNGITGLPSAQTSNPPNPDLRWEKVGLTNIGVDFGSKNNRLTGSIEYFDKQATDLVINAPIDLTKGFRTQTLNSADLHGKGLELTLNSININTRDFQWNSTFIFNYNRTITTRYFAEVSSGSNYISNSNLVNPIEGKDAYSVVAYQWAELDPANGDPQGYLNGQVSKDYVNLLNAKVSDLHYFGSSIPMYYGAFRNTFSYKGIELSANILYKLNYYFKRTGIDYNRLYSMSTGNAEFTQRWQKPGDEKNTDVPSMIYPGNSNRDAFYNGSAALVEKADQIRLQDITAAYVLPNKIHGIRNIRIYLNINNIGIIWRANHKGIDPDIISGYPVPRSLSLGLNVNL